MEITDLELLRVPSEPTLSPDGRRAAVSVTRLDFTSNSYRSDIWIVDVGAADPPRKFTGGPCDTSPRFSPDGRWLAFLRAHDKAKPQLYVMPAHGGEPRKLTDHHLGVGEPAWSPDSTRLAYSARLPEPGRYGTDPDVAPEQEEPRRITTFEYRLDGLGFIHDRRPHIFVIDAITEGAKPRQITDGDYDDTMPAWAPDGTHLAFVSARHPARDSDLAADVFVVPAGGGETRQVTRTDLIAAHPSFSPEGDAIYFKAPRGLDTAGRPDALWRVAVDGLTPAERCTDPQEHDLSNRLVPRQPVLADKDSVIAVSQQRGAVPLLRFSVDGEEAETIIGGRRQVQTYDRANGTIAAVVTSDVSAGELVAVRDGEERALTDFGGELARAAALRPMEELHATAPDGAEVHGWLIRPAGNGPFPVLLMVHGGPFTQYGYTLSDEAQMYAGAGYAVVMGNPRGSAGYGEAHGRAIVGDLGHRDAEDLLSLLDAALDDPALDADRVGVIGGSYGGFMSAWLAARTDYFVTAVIERAVTAWDSFAGSSDIGWYFAGEYCGDELASQLAQSPLTYADQVRCPTLIIHSEQDLRCPLEQAQRLYERLKRNGLRTELLLFPGEGHDLSRSGLPRHRVARFDAILQWLDETLKT